MSFFQDQPAIIKIQLFVIVLLWVFFVLFSIIIFWHRLRVNMKRRYSQLLEDKTQQWVYNFLLNDDFMTWIKQPAVVNVLKAHYEKEYKTHLDKEILVDILHKLHENISGNIKEHVRAFFFLLELDTITMAVLNKNSWETKAKALKVMAEMQIAKSDKVILHYINHEEPALRREARLAYVRVNPKNLIYFLEKIATGISEWEMLNLIEIISKDKMHYLSHFTPFYSDNNPSLTLLSIRIINNFRLVQYCNDLTRLLNHSDRNILNLTIQTIGTLEYVEALPLLTIQYVDFEEREKMAVLKVISSIGSIQDKGFLLKVIHDEDSNSARLLAMKALKNIGVSEEEIKETLVDTVLLNSMLAHIADERILW